LRGDDLGGDRTADQIAYALDDLSRIALLLCQQGGIRGGAGENPPGCDLLDLGDTPGVDEQPHAAELTGCAGSMPSPSATAVHSSASARTRRALHPSSP